MRKLLALLPLAAIALAVAVSGALADHGDVARPACADIRNADFGYSESKIVTGNIETDAASCKSITYTLFVLDEPGDAAALQTPSTRGDGDAFFTTGSQAGHDLVTLTTSSGDDDNQVCLYVTTSKGGNAGMNQLIDRTPDTDCVLVQVGGVGGTPFH